MNDQALQAHVLRTLAQAHFTATRLTLDELTETLGVRRTDVRRTLSTLDRADLVDAIRVRLTLAGFVAAHALTESQLAPLRAPHAERTSAAA